MRISISRFVVGAIIRSYRAPNKSISGSPERFAAQRVDVPNPDMETEHG